MSDHRSEVSRFIAGQEKVYSSGLIPIVRRTDCLKRIPLAEMPSIDHFGAVRLSDLPRLKGAARWIGPVLEFEVSPEIYEGVWAILSRPTITMESEELWLLCGDSKTLTAIRAAFGPLDLEKTTGQQAQEQERT